MPYTPPVKKRMGPLERILGLITDPRAVFKEIKAHPDFLLPLLFLFLMALGSLPESQFSQELMVRQFPQLPPAETPSPFSPLNVFTGTLVLLFSWLLKTLLHYGMAILLGGEGSFKNTLSIMGYTYLPALLQTGLTAFTLHIYGRPIILGLGLFLPPSQQYFSWSGILLSQINIFELALILLITIGLAVAMDISRKKSLFITLSFWIITQGILVGSMALTLRFLERL